MNHADRAATEAAWGARVRAHHEQSARVRETPEGGDFYAPVSRLFVADPRRTDDEVLNHLLALAHPSDTWLDIGAGAGRYALPLALRVREVIALDPSPGMLAALHEQAIEHGIANVRAIEGRWPVDPTLGPAPTADVTLIATPRLRRGGDRPVPRRDGGCRRAAVRGHPRGSPAVGPRACLLAARSRRGADRAAGARGLHRCAAGARARSAGGPRRATVRATSRPGTSWPAGCGASSSSSRGVRRTCCWSARSQPAS